MRKSTGRLRKFCIHKRHHLHSVRTLEFTNPSVFARNNSNICARAHWAQVLSVVLARLSAMKHRDFGGPQDHWCLKCTEHYATARAPIREFFVKTLRGFGFAQVSEGT